MTRYNILLMGASYGSLLASKLLFGGHSVHLVCLPAEADLINASLQQPVLLVVGAEDARFAAVARDLAQRLPCARLAVVPDAGHAAHLENSRAFASIARDFLAEADAAAATRPTQPQQATIAAKEHRA